MKSKYISIPDTLILDKNLKKLVPVEYKKFMSELKKADMELIDITMPTESIPENVQKAYETLQLAFEKKTTIISIDGTISYLKLSLESYESLDYYIDENASYWSVNNVYSLTPSGLEFSKYLHDVRSSFEACII